MSQPFSSRIALNFFPLRDQDFEFVIYRRLKTEGEKREAYPDCKERKLPVAVSLETKKTKDSQYQRFWVSYSIREGFEKSTCTSRTNNSLTVHYLYHLLKQRCLSLNLAEYIFDEDARGFVSRVLFILQIHAEGKEVVWLQPYYLRSKREFGFLADFKLQMPSGTRTTSSTLELSLATKNGQPNKDFYLDRFNKLQQFVSRYHGRVFPLSSESDHIVVQKTLREVETSLLEPKTYVFAGEIKSNSQFSGIKSNGPLQMVKDDIKIYFVYRPGDRSLSVDLYRALNGDSFKTFPGMEEMFGIKLDRDRVGGIPTSGFQVSDIEQTCAAIAKDAKGRAVVPVLITPFRKGGGDEDNRTYHLVKHTILKHHWPSQFVSVDRLRDKNVLKWAISNIGLQLFAKMGGQPWRVAPKTGRCLIVGLGQAHRVADGIIKKYFAYSVLTDSSGLYEDLRVLGSSSDEGNYIEEFKQNLLRILQEFQGQYSRFVIHATFSIQKRELDAVREVFDTMQPNGKAGKEERDFIVIKFNEKNRFFGYSTNSNSLVPYESSFLSLSDSEFLVWFEGLQRTSPNIFKRIERPVHVKFLYPESELARDRKMAYLQDAVNLSGANWRGFNAKSLPVSIFYAKIIADYFKEFQALGLEDIDLNAITPWFL